MRSPAQAIAWEFSRRHGRGAVAIVTYFVGLGLFRLVMRARGQAIELDELQMALVLTIPMTTAFIYFLAVFSFGLGGDLAARQSMFPARFFALPVTTADLTAWPMVYGCAVIVTLWAAIRLIGPWPSTVHVPGIWPGLLAASLLAWTQALTWMPYPVPGLRVIATILWLGAIDTIVILAMHFHAGEFVMLALLAPNVPLAYVVARRAVARSRRGDIPDWSRRMRGDGVRGYGTRAASRRFRSAADAQTWFEWRRHGRRLPALVAILLPFEAVLLFTFRDTPALVLETVLAMLATPAFMAGFVAASVSDSSLQGFAGTRPMSTAVLTASPVRAASWSTGATWMLVCVAVPLALVASGTLPIVIERARATQTVFGTPRSIAILLGGFVGFVLWTWKRLVQGLYLGLTGREWLIKGYALLTLSLLTLVGPVLWLAGNRRIISAVWDGLPWIFGVLVALKMAAVCWTGVRLFRQRLVSDRALVIGAACWTASVFVLDAVFVWFVDTPYVPHYMLMLMAILAVPLARISAAPVALASNRHQ
jgi:hypothetical protein